MFDSKMTMLRWIVLCLCDSFVEADDQFHQEGDLHGNAQLHKCSHVPHTGVPTFTNPGANCFSRFSLWPQFDIIHPALDHDCTENFGSGKNRYPGSYLRKFNNNIDTNATTGAYSLFNLPVISEEIRNHLQTEVLQSGNDIVSFINSAGTTGIEKERLQDIIEKDHFEKGRMKGPIKLKPIEKDLLNDVVHGVVQHGTISQTISQSHGIHDWVTGDPIAASLTILSDLLQDNSGTAAVRSPENEPIWYLDALMLRDKCNFGTTDGGSTEYSFTNLLGVATRFMKQQAQFLTEQFSWVRQRIGFMRSSSNTLSTTLPERLSTDNGSSIDSRSYSPAALDVLTDMLVQGYIHFSLIDENTLKWDIPGIMNDDQRLQETRQRLDYNLLHDPYKIDISNTFFCFHNGTGSASVPFMHLHVFQSVYYEEFNVPARAEYSVNNTLGCLRESENENPWDTYGCICARLAGSRLAQVNLSKSKGAMLAPPLKATNHNPVVADSSTLPIGMEHTTSLQAFRELARQIFDGIPYYKPSGVGDEGLLSRWRRGFPTTNPDSKDTSLEAENYELIARFRGDVNVGNVRSKQFSHDNVISMNENFVQKPEQEIEWF